MKIRRPHGRIIFMILLRRGPGRRKLAWTLMYAMACMSCDMAIKKDITVPLYGECFIVNK